MKIRTDFVTNSSSSSFVLEIKIELETGWPLEYQARGCCGEGEIFDYGSIDVKVSPRQLGNAKNIVELAEMLEKGVLDTGVSDGKPIQIIQNSYLINNIKDLPDMNSIKRITIKGNEYGRYANYFRTYTYDLNTKKYTSRIFGSEFEKDGGSGGDLIFSDASLATDEEFEFSKGISYLNIKNHTFVTTGLSNRQNTELERLITSRGGIMSGSVSDKTYCLIVNEEYGQFTTKYDKARENDRIIIMGMEQFKKMLDKAPDENEPKFRTVERKAYDGGTYNILSDVYSGVEKMDFINYPLGYIWGEAFKGCSKLKELSLSTSEGLVNNIFSDCPIEKLTLAEGATKVSAKWFKDMKLPEVEMPLFPIGKCENSETKKILVENYLKALERGENVDEIMSRDYDKYLKKQRAEFYSDSFALEYMAKNGLIPDKEAKEIAEAAEREGDFEKRDLLLSGIPSGKEFKKTKKSRNSDEISKEKIWETKVMPDGTLGNQT